MKKENINNTSFKESVFLIAPIGKSGTAEYDKYVEILKFIISPAVENSGYKLKLIRADEIRKPGSIVKDILLNLVNSHIVIADLTDQNPNVFYELGVRHSFSPRTILIAQDTKWIPFDLKDYRTIIYETSAKGSHEFKETLKQYLDLININPDEVDNPVLERFGEMANQRVEIYQAEIARLEEIIKALTEKGGLHKAAPIDNGRSLTTRLKYIYELENIEIRPVNGRNLTSLFYDINKKDKEFKFKIEQGLFRLHWKSDKRNNVGDIYYIYINKDSLIDWRDLFPDIRILINYYDKAFLPETINFVVATSGAIDENERSKVEATFSKMIEHVSSKNKKKFNILLWDSAFIAKWENKLGLSIPESQ